MTDKNYTELIELRKTDNGFVPVNENAMNLLLTSKPYESIFVTECTQRDLKFHRCYFKLISNIYFMLPDSFKEHISSSQFHNFLKCLTGQSKVVHEFKELPPLVEYDSISFGRMSQKKFEGFVRDQLSAIYTELLPKYKLEFLIDEIEENFEKFIIRLEV